MGEGSPKTHDTAFNDLLFLPVHPLSSTQLQPGPLAPPHIARRHHRRSPHSPRTPPAPWSSSRPPTAGRSGPRPASTGRRAAKATATPPVGRCVPDCQLAVTDFAPLGRDGARGREGADGLGERKRGRDGKRGFEGEGEGKDWQRVVERAETGGVDGDGKGGTPRVGEGRPRCWPFRVAGRPRAHGPGSAGFRAHSAKRGAHQARCGAGRGRADFGRQSRAGTRDCP